MPRKTIKSLEDELHILKIKYDVLEKRHEIISEKYNFLKMYERRFDQLLEGMCMGMREGALPRRTHAQPQ